MLWQILNPVVAGSAPSEDVRDRCIRNKWLLKADLTDEELKNEYLGATCSILPFDYSSGGKLKLLKSLAYGVPFLATSIVGSPLNGLPEICLYSDDPEQWVQAVENLIETGVGFAAQKKLAAIASEFSWAALAGAMASEIEGHYESQGLS